MYCHVQESNKSRSPIGLVQMNSDQNASTMMCEAFVMYLVHTVLHIFSLTLLRKRVYNRRKLLRLTPAEYEERKRWFSDI